MRSYRRRSKFGVFTDAKGKADRTADGITFHSKKELRRYQELKLLQRSGEITGLELQPRFPLVVNGVKVCTYVADFRYRNHNGLMMCVEDVKGRPTETYSLKKKLFEALYAPLKITEV